MLQIARALQPPAESARQPLAEAVNGVRLQSLANPCGWGQQDQVQVTPNKALETAAQPQVRKADNSSHGANELIPRKEVTVNPSLRSLVEWLKSQLDLLPDEQARSLRNELAHKG